MTIPTTADEVRAAVERELPRVIADLERHVAIQSVSAGLDRADQVLSSATFVAGLLRDLGAAEVSIDAVDGGQPAVIAHFPAPAGQPTVCLYAHHDVQPEG